jgi:hypothetical protein
MMPGLLTEAFQKFMLIPLDGGGETVSFQYNPEEVAGPDANPTYGVQEVLGRELPVVEYTSGGQSTISFKIKIGRKQSDSDVKDMIDKLIKLTKPDQQGGGGGQGPPKAPRCSFVGGEQFQDETVVVQSVKPVVSRMINPMTLLATHAEVQITLLRVGDEEQ